MLNRKEKSELSSENRQMTQMMHEIANSLHLLGLQAELARSHMDSGNREAATAAVESVIRERDNCRRITQEIHRRLREDE
jgi:hypothetical protein